MQFVTHAVLFCLEVALVILIGFDDYGHYLGDFQAVALYSMSTFDDKEENVWKNNKIDTVTIKDTYKTGNIA